MAEMYVQGGIHQKGEEHTGEDVRAGGQLKPGVVRGEDAGRRDKDFQGTSALETKSLMIFVLKIIQKNDVVAIGTHGCIKRYDERIVFEAGFVEMIKRLTPKIVCVKPLWYAA